MSENTTPSDEIQDDQVDISAAAEAQQKNEDSPDAQPSVESLQAEIERLQDALTQAQDQALRSQAEAQNARRRAQQDVEKAHKFALEKFVSDVLPVADNLERAAEAASNQAGDFAAVAEGVQLTLKTLLDALKKHSVEQVHPEGEPFDPQLHQAMTMVENPDVEPNTVVNVFQRGYTLSGRLVRPAMVVVSKTPSGQ